MNYSKNETTTINGQAIATVITDSVHNAKRITTVELVYPRYIHSELLTHRQFSRNASSSRATPVNVLIEEARNPVFFDLVYKNKSGMQGSELLSQEELAEFKRRWQELANYTADWVQDTMQKLGVHKEHINRVLEPFTQIRVLVTATEFDNFFKLRLSPDAQPEMYNLAKAIKDAMAKSTPRITDIHIPYVDEDLDPETQIKVAVARCARVSYPLKDRPTTVEDDVKLYDRLLKSKHLSPFEHIAFAADGPHKNFIGWRSLRTYKE